MQIHEVIRNRRTAMSMTQEGLAQRLGVSAAAVNKWERALNYPDITLLPTLARTLGVDLNTLLSFQEDLTEKQVEEFVNELAQTARKQGFQVAFQMAQEKLREFPGCDGLACEVAGILDGALILWTEQEEQVGQEKWKEEIQRLYERCAQSVDPQVRNRAEHALIPRYIAQGELERAEGLLSTLSETDEEKSRLKAMLRKKQGRGAEAWPILERELFNQVHSIQTTLLSLMELALEENDREAARTFSETATAAGEVFDLWPYAVASAPFQLAVAERDAPAALAALEQVLSSLTKPWDLSASPLYRHLPTKEGAGEVQALLLPYLLEEIEKDPQCAFLRSEPEWAPMIAAYRRWADTSYH